MRRIENISNLLSSIRFDSSHNNNYNHYIYNQSKIRNSVDMIKVNNKIRKINEYSEHNTHCSYLEYKITGNESFGENAPNINKFKHLDMNDNKMNNCMKDDLSISPNKNISFSISSPEKRLVIASNINLSIRCETYQDNLMTDNERKDTSKRKFSKDLNSVRTVREEYSNIKVIKTNSSYNKDKSLSSSNEIKENLPKLRIGDIDNFIPESKNIPTPIFENVENKNKSYFKTENEEKLAKPSSNYNTLSKLSMESKNNYIREKELNSINNNNNNLSIKNESEAFQKQTEVSYNLNNNIPKYDDNLIKQELEEEVETVKPESNVKSKNKDSFSRSNNNNDPSNFDIMDKLEKFTNVSTIKIEKNEYLKSEDNLFSPRSHLEENLIVNDSKIHKESNFKKKNEKNDLNERYCITQSDDRRNKLLGSKPEMEVYTMKKESGYENMFNESNIERLHINNNDLEKVNVDKENILNIQQNSSVKEEAQTLKKESLNLKSKYRYTTKRTYNKEEDIYTTTEVLEPKVSIEYKNAMSNIERIPIRKTSTTSEEEYYRNNINLSKEDKSKNSNLSKNINNCNYNQDDLKNNQIDYHTQEHFKKISQRTIDLANRRHLLLPPDEINFNSNYNYNTINKKNEFKPSEIKEKNDIKSDENNTIKFQTEMFNERPTLKLDPRTITLEEDSMIYNKTNEEKKEDFVKLNSTENLKVVSSIKLSETVNINNIGNEVRYDSLISSNKDTSFNHSDSKKNATHILNPLTNSLNNTKEISVFQPKNKKAFSIDLKNKNLSTLIDSNKKLPMTSTLKDLKKSEEKKLTLKNNDLIEGIRINTITSNDLSKISNENITPVFNKKQINNSSFTLKKQDKSPQNQEKNINKPIKTEERYDTQETVNNQEIYKKSLNQNINPSDERRNQITEKPLTTKDLANDYMDDNNDNFNQKGEKKSFDLNESEISENFNNNKVLELNNSNSFNDSYHFKNINNIKIEGGSHMKNDDDNNLKDSKPYNNKDKIDFSHAENNEILNILDNLIINETKLPKKTKSSFNRKIIQNYIEENNNDANKDPNLINANYKIGKEKTKKKSVHINEEMLIKKESKNIPDKSDTFSNKTLSKLESKEEGKDNNKLEEMKVIEIFADINEFYRDLKESKKVIEENLNALNKNIDLKDLKNCNQVIKEVDHDNTIDVNTRAIIIKNLEKFKFENVKEKLEKLFLKYKNYGNISSDLMMCLNSFRKPDEDNKEIYSVFEPLELDKTLQTLLNCSNQFSVFNFSNMKLDDLISNVSTKNKEKQNINYQTSASPNKKTNKQITNEKTSFQRKSIDKGKMMKIGEEQLGSTIKSNSNQKSCSRSKSDFASKYLKNNNELPNKDNKTSKLKSEMKKIRMSMNLKMNNLKKKNESPCKNDQEFVKKNQCDISLAKIEKDELILASRVQNQVSEKEIQFKSFRSQESQLDRFDNSENLIAISKPNSNNNSIMNVSGTNANKGFIRSSSINVVQSKTPSMTNMNETLPKNLAFSNTVKGMNVSASNNPNERKSVVDVLTTRVRQANKTVSDKRLKFSNNLYNQNLTTANDKNDIKNKTLK